MPNRLPRTDLQIRRLGVRGRVPFLGAGWVFAASNLHLTRNRLWAVVNAPFKTRGDLQVDNPGDESVAARAVVLV